MKLKKTLASIVLSTAGLLAASGAGSTVGPREPPVGVVYNNAVTLTVVDVQTAVLVDGQPHRAVEVVAPVVVALLDDEVFIKLDDVPLARRQRHRGIRDDAVRRAGQVGRHFAGDRVDQPARRRRCGRHS